MPELRVIDLKTSVFASQTWDYVGDAKSVRTANCQ
jgi:hypothetical protein